MSFINMLEIIYPVGSVYISTNSTSPSNIIGGTWTAIPGAVLRANNQAGVYSDSDTCTLTVSQMPAHTHKSGTYYHNVANGSARQCISYNYTGDDGPSVNTTTSTGGGKSHTNKQRAFNIYAWYRTA